MLAVINNLREIRERCRADGMLDPPLSRWLAESLDRFLNHECASLEDALGLRQPRGGVPWWLVEAMYARDAALRDLANALAGERSVSARAREVCKLTDRYASSAWLRDRERETMPATYADTALQYVWAAFKSGAPMPLGERQLRNILAG